jgi:small subunit ribosomal protein S16
MAVKIRLARGGSKKRPTYRLVVANDQARRDGRFIEWIGHYHPMVAADHPDRFVFKADRLQHWFAQGAHPTERVIHLLERAGVTFPEYIAKLVAIKKKSQRPKAPKSDAA